MNYQRIITLRHLMIDGVKMIGLEYKNNEAVDKLVKTLNNPMWNDQFEMMVIKNTKQNVNDIFKTFKGIAYINGKYFFRNKPINQENPKVDLSKLKRETIGKKDVPPEYIQQLEIRRYAENTAKIYVYLFRNFINYYHKEELHEIDERMIKDYMQHIVREGYSRSTQNQIINAIKFYYEQVLNQAQRFYFLERPFKEKKLPVVLTEEEISRIIKSIDNIKHQAIIALMYSSGLRISELIHLKISDIQSDTKTILIRAAKGQKDRISILSISILEMLRNYYQEYKPQAWLFEGIGEDKKYSTSSISAILKRACIKAKINKSNVTPHSLRHSFATHLLDNGTDIRTIQKLLGHTSIKTTEIYTHVSTKDIESIKSPFDRLDLK